MVRFGLEGVDVPFFFLQSGLCRSFGFPKVDLGEFLFVWEGRDCSGFWRCEMDGRVWYRIFVSVVVSLNIV